MPTEQPVSNDLKLRYVEFLRKQLAYVEALAATAEISESTRQACLQDAKLIGRKLIVAEQLALQ